MSISSTQKSAAMIVIGDEILSGRTRDANMFHAAKALFAHGIDLRYAAVIPDEAALIIETITQLRKAYDHVLTSGGIGPTHDDITADCVAKAFGVPIDVRPDARAILATNYANGEADLTPARLRMARIPKGASLIANPISKAPGFSLENVHVMAGVPHIFAAQLEDLLTRLPKGEATIALARDVHLPESAIAEPLGQIAQAHPTVSIGSYPWEREGAQGRRYGSQIVMRAGDRAAGMAALRDLVAAFPEHIRTPEALLFEVIDATWPAESVTHMGAFTLRHSPEGAGSRVSCASYESDLPFNPQKMRLPAHPLFMVRAGQETLDEALVAEGYDIYDPVVVYDAPLLPERAPTGCEILANPDSAMVAHWEAGGIGAPRRDVMARAPEPKAYAVIREGGSTIGAAFAALHKGVMMIHALEVAPEARGKRHGAQLMIALSQWARAEGADRLSLIVRAENPAAHRLYTRLGLQAVSRYHYRKARS